MKREILCLNCGSTAKQLPTPPEDVLAGFHRRWQRGCLISHAHCDQCDRQLEPNADVITHCMWQGPEPGNWESDYIYEP